MSKERLLSRHLIAAILSFALIFSGFSFQAFADGDSSTVDGTLKLGTKKSITFENLDYKIYKITIPKAGKYRMDFYSSYHNDFNADFWVGVYKSMSNAKSGSNIINSISGTHNYQNPERDYAIYSLSARTYYLVVEAFSTKRPDFGLKVKAATDDDLYEMYPSDDLYAGMEREFLSVGYYDSDKEKSYEGRITSVSSSNKSVVGITKESVIDDKGKKVYIYYLNFKKPGTSKLTVRYTRPNGKKATIKKTLRVNKYPKMVKSLKVNGKSVSLSKYKFRYTVNSYKKSSVKIKMAAKSGWKIRDVTADYYGKQYKYSELKKSVVTKGSSVSFPKKYRSVIFYIYMEDKDGNTVSYEVDFFR